MNPLGRSKKEGDGGSQMGEIIFEKSESGSDRESSSGNTYDSFDDQAQNELLFVIPEEILASYEEFSKFVNPEENQLQVNWIHKQKQHEMKDGMICNIFQAKHDNLP